MDIIVRNLPQHCDDDECKQCLTPYLSELSIYVFEFKRLHNRKCAIITIPHLAAAQKFLDRHGKRPGIVNNRGVPLEIKIDGLRIYCEKSRNSPDIFVLRRLRQASTQAIKSSAGISSSKHAIERPIQVSSIDCGYFDYDDRNHLAFHRCYRGDYSGSFVVGRKRLLVRMDGSSGPPHQVHVVIEFPSIYSIYAALRQKPILIFSLASMPFFYEERLASDSDPLSQALSLLNIAPAQATKDQTRRYRRCGLGSRHAQATNSCFVYCVNFDKVEDLKRALSALQNQRGAPKPVTLTHTIPVVEADIGESMRMLKSQLSRENELHFDIKFQLFMLAQNGVLSPRKTRKLYAPVLAMTTQFDKVRIVEALRALGIAQPFAGPKTNGRHFDVEKLTQFVRDKASKFTIRGSMYAIARKHDHLALIHKAMISPAGMWLEGPVLETKNRVLRKYPDDTQSFLRIHFCDEDGEQIRYEPKVNRDAIFQERFRAVMSDGIYIAGRLFTFLGFSHSSLRTQTCWFMAPFWDRRQDKLLLAQMLIKNLGNFIDIKCPARCAARIGQAFSDATDTISMQGATYEIMRDIERNGRCFSDGCGTLSQGLLDPIHRRFSRARKMRATILQIRFQGFKGVLSLDSTLRGKTARFRDSMNKFESDHPDLEITGAAYRPLATYLNRQYINILEALGTKPENFIALQKRALEQIDQMTQSAVNAATYLEMNLFGTAVGLPQLIRSLYYKGLDFKKDPFLVQAVEMATRVQLREIKHKARIPVEDAHTLYGVVDETGHLKSNEIHVIVQEKDGEVFSKLGTCLVTRSPAMHPGDFQIVDAITVPSGSPNSHLHNCIIFSQYGERDIPSKLSGGDLDGDLYSVIFDRSLFPERTAAAAEYPRVKPLELDRPVEIADMSNFFLLFMEQDKLGHICYTHMSIADQKPESVFHEACIKLAGMASTAVDFSKTGIPVKMSDFPDDYDRRIRPDFIAPEPRLVLKANATSIDTEDDMDYHDMPDNVDKALNTGRAGFRYYESPNILGQLYRNIDETMFFGDKWSVSDNSDTLTSERQNRIFLGELWNHVARSVRLVEWDTRESRSFAMDVRDSYEETLVDMMHQYSPHHRQPLSELEVFCGTILGREGAMPSRRMRETNVDLREAFSLHVQEHIRWITRGSSGVDEEDLDDDDDDAEDDKKSSISKWETSSVTTSTTWAGTQDKNTGVLERTVACLSLAIRDSTDSRHEHVGVLRSFTYLVAGLCLKELDKHEAMNRRMQHSKARALGAQSSTQNGRAVPHFRSGLGNRLPN